MIGVLESQLRFVQHVQSIDTTGVEPLSSIRDDTAEGLREAAITLDQLKSALDDEISLGRVKRPRRIPCLLWLQGTKIPLVGPSESDTHVAAVWVCVDAVQFHMYPPPPKQPNQGLAKLHLQIMRRT
ncbi:hypothetical protein P8C59_005325 [Phyllachora maydis]|uniref:Uncharacterized protein n=1 Tax=Phyllachora maydis TaxID=1825666 RepID=A0AAD9MEE5_9PEZI|nr:hypothetical protein P8C59_005325 [Phyllachora maydis]